MYNNDRPHKTKSSEFEDDAEFVFISNPPKKMAGVRPRIVINCSGTCFDETLEQRKLAMFRGDRPESYELISHLTQCCDSLNIKHYDEGLLNVQAVNELINSGKKFSQLHFQLPGAGTEGTGGGPVPNSKSEIAFDKITGIGCKDNVAYAIELVMHYLKALYVEQTPSAFIFVGWSRGGITTLMLAQAFYNLFRDVPVYIFAIDPVPGPFIERNFPLTPNIKDMRVVINGASGHPVGYDPLQPEDLRMNRGDKRIFAMNASNDSTAICKWRSYPGGHSSCVIKSADPASKKEESYIYDLSASWLRESLDAWSVELIEGKANSNGMLLPLSDVEKLERYSYLSANLEGLTPAKGRREWAMEIMKQGYINAEHEDIYKSILKITFRDKSKLEYYSDIQVKKFLENTAYQGKNLFYCVDHAVLLGTWLPEITYKISDGAMPLPDEFDTNLIMKINSLPKTKEYLRKYKLFFGYDDEVLEFFSHWKIAKLPRVPLIRFTDLFPEDSKERRIFDAHLPHVAIKLRQGFIKQFHDYQHESIQTEFPETYRLLVAAKLIVK